MIYQKSERKQEEEGRKEEKNSKPQLDFQNQPTQILLLEDVLYSVT